MWATPTYAANCQTLFENTAVAFAKNDSASVALGAVGSLLASNQLSETENFIQSELRKIDYRSLFYEITNIQLIDNKDKNYDKIDCLVRINFNKLTVKYSFRTDIKVEADIFLYTNGKLVFQKNEVINENIGGIPEPRSPRRKFKMINGKYVEITPQKLTNQEAFEKFKPDFIKAMSKIFLKIYGRYHSNF